MAAEFDKENIADGLLTSSSQKRDAPSPKKAKKSRSLSMGPGALNVPLKEDAGNRRKVGESRSVPFSSILTSISLHSPQQNLSSPAKRTKQSAGKLEGSPWVCYEDVYFFFEAY
jgi:hypothetical protein